MSSKEHLRVVIVGTSCAGKTTMSGKLSDALSIENTDLDDLHWLPKWQEREVSEFRFLVEEVANRDAWIIAGNYRPVKDLIWPRATHIIWLNYSFPRVFWRALKRTFVRSITRKPVCNGNYESIFKALFTRDSILYWVISTHKRRRREFRKVLGKGHYENATVVELQRPPEHLQQVIAQLV